MNAVFSKIPSLFIDQPEHSILTIGKKDHSYSLSVCHQCDPEITKLTLECLKEIVGEKRLKRVCRKPEIGIDVEKIDQQTLVLTKEIVRKVFVGLSDVQKEDLIEFCHPQGPREAFRQLTIFSCMEDFESSLMGFGPKRNDLEIDRATTSGKGFEGLVERIYITMHHHFRVLEETNRKAAELREVEFLTSRLADREIQEGSVLHLNEGCFYVDKVLVGGGAYISILRDIEGEKTPVLVCRGTAMRRTATGGLQSGINDALVEIGTMGIRSQWSELSKYLKNSQIKSIKLLGKSLGGAHVQGLAILIEGLDGIKVEKLTTFCSVGVGRKINALFEKEVLEKRETPFEVQIIRNGDQKREKIDTIPAIGGVHLGEGSSPEKCKIEVSYIQPGDEEVGIYPENPGLLESIRNFLGSFRYGHCRQTTLDKFRWKTIDDRNQINAHLRVGNRLETIRLMFAYTLHVLTLFLLNGWSFSSYFYRQRDYLNNH